MASAGCFSHSDNSQRGHGLSHSVPTPGGRVAMATGSHQCDFHGKDFLVWCDQCQKPVCLAEMTGGGCCKLHDHNQFPEKFEEHQKKGRFEEAYSKGEKFVQQKQQLRSVEGPKFDNAMEVRVEQLLKQVDPWKQEQVRLCETEGEKHVEDVRFRFAAQGDANKQKHGELNHLKEELNKHKDIHLPGVQRTMAAKVQEAQDELEKAKQKLADAEQIQAQTLAAEQAKIKEKEDKLADTEKELAEGETLFATLENEFQQVHQTAKETFQSRQSDLENSVDAIKKSICEAGKKAVAIFEAWSQGVQEYETAVSSKIMETRKQASIAGDAQAAKWALIAEFQLLQLIEERDSVTVPNAPAFLPIVGFEKPADIDESMSACIDVWVAMVRTSFLCPHPNDAVNMQKKKEEEQDNMSRAAAAVNKLMSIEGKVFGKREMVELLRELGFNWSDETSHETSDESGEQISKPDPPPRRGIFAVFSRT